MSNNTKNPNVSPNNKNNYSVIPTNRPVALGSGRIDFQGRDVENGSGRIDYKGQDVENHSGQNSIQNSGQNSGQKSDITITRSNPIPPVPSYFDGEMTEDDFCYFWTGLIVLLVSIIIITSTVSMSYHYVRYDEYAFEINRYHGVHMGHVYTEGRYFLTLDNTMTYFKSTYQPIKFVSATFSDNGLEFDLDISFYYKIPKENLAQIYNLYSTSYEGKIESNAKQITKNIASTFSVEEFLTNRSYIEKTIGYALEAQLNKTLKVYVPTDYFKIISIKFPEILVSKSLDTAIALQNNEIASLQQAVNVINADTTQMVSEITAQSNRVIQYAQTQSTLIQSNANSQSSNILLTARTDGMELFCSILNITNPHHINKINKIFGIIDGAKNLTLFNTDNNVIMNV